MQSCLSFHAVALCLAFWLVVHTAGQGLHPSQTSTVGSSSTLTHLQQLYSSSKAWKRAYKQRPKAACSSTSGTSLCAAASTDAVNTYAQLMLAASPEAYSSTNASKVQLVAPPQNQQECQTCAAFAVAAAAETAMASALQVDVQQCSISVQALYFCPPSSPGRSCSAGWNLLAALELLQQQSQSLLTAACLPYRPDFRRELSAAELCAASCSSVSQHASKGSFSSQQITSMWEAQMHIRQYGAVVTRFDVMTDFRPFFADKRNAKAVYRPRPGARHEFSHAITLVGYDNQQQYWLAKNSYGSSWGDGGFFRVAYGVCSILTPDTGEAYGVIWTPHSTPGNLQLPLMPGPKPGCFWYKARSGDYLAMVSWLAGIPLDKLLLDNTAYVKDLDSSLQGTQLLLCNPKQGAAYDASKSDPQLDALLRVKAAIDTTGVLQGWTRSTGADGGYCSWQGVLCAKGTSNVYWVNIWPGGGTNGLQGTLPSAAAFTGLRGLTHLCISDQPGITGTLPADWSSLTALQDVRLPNNSLSGSIPSSWGSLTKLKVLMLYMNKLSGPVPGSFNMLTALENLEMGRNAFTSTIPDLSKLTKLKVLFLNNNKLTGTIPEGLKALTALRKLELASNALLGGTLPAWLGGFRNLELLTLHSSSFKGSIPAALGSLSELRVLYLGDCQLSGPLPDALKALANLEELGLEDNALVGTVPASWSGMKSLRQVWLSSNAQLKGCLPSTWRRQLADWDVEENMYGGTGIRSFC